MSKRTKTVSNKQTHRTPYDKNASAPRLIAEELMDKSTELKRQAGLMKSALESMKADLPHLYGFPWYKWSKAFFESRNKKNLMVGPNQVSKSSSAIRKNIEWACNRKLWPELWPTQPRVFWYFYPDFATATAEFIHKWIPEFLPRGDFKKHPEYGWKEFFASGDIESVTFNTGVTIYFKAYGQKLINLQAQTIHMITCDEEMPPTYVDELMARLVASQGYFNMTFTATQGHELWYRAMECVGSVEESFPDAFKQVVSLYDCMEYEDGSPSPWTLERIRARERECSTEAEKLRRVFGRFVKDEGRKYPTFRPDIHARTPEDLGPVPSDWRWYAGVDVGSGGYVKGRRRSSGAIVIIAVNPQFTKGRIKMSWRGDYTDTTASDILQKYREMLAYLKCSVTNAAYDHASREFQIIASRSGEPFVQAKKDRFAGEKLLNELFKSGALEIESGGGDNVKLITELMTVPAGVSKKFVDDLTDALRYAALLIPWDFPRISPSLGALNAELSGVDEDFPPINATPEEYARWEIKQRRRDYDSERKTTGWVEFEEEIAEWNEAYGS